jgi:phosphate transport system substrate-binding protein
MERKKGIFLVLGILTVGQIYVFAEMSNSIQIKGSDTMVNLGQAWAEAYMKKHPEAFVAVTGGGSGTGIAALINGTCDIAEVSREMKQKEIDLARSKGVEPKEFKVALDGLAVAVHPENPIVQLTIDEVADIFTGKIRNWKEIGRGDAPIVILSREVNSGTHLYFKEHVLRKGDPTRKDEFAEGALLLPSSQAIADEVTQNKNAIGYYGMGYINPKNKAIAIAKDKNSPYYEPNIENVRTGDYYIARPLLMYTNGEPKGLVKDFLGFIFSEEGQKVVRDVEFVPIK